MEANKVYKFNFFVDFEKEEKWLEEMASKGYHLKSTSFGYRFEKGHPEVTTIKKDFRKFKKQEDFLDYRTLFEDSGWKQLVGTKSSGDQYFKKIDDSVSDEIFSDNTSKAARYKRYSNMSFELAFAFLPILVAFYVTDIIDFNVFVNPKELYLTPGLWDKTGSAFWSAFLFETPFALMRGFIWLFIPLMIVFYLIFGYQSNQLYLKSKVSEK